MLFPFKRQTFIGLDFNELSKMIEFIGSEYLNEPISLSYSIFKAKVERETPKNDNKRDIR